MDLHGAKETNPVRKEEQEVYLKPELPCVDWKDPNLKRITRLRLLSDPGFPVWDVSYCWGELKDGSPCYVDLPFDQLPKKGMREAIVKWAKQDRVYAKGLGIFDNISTLV